MFIKLNVFVNNILPTLVFMLAKMCKIKYIYRLTLKIITVIRFLANSRNNYLKI